MSTIDRTRLAIEKAGFSPIDPSDYSPDEAMTIATSKAQKEAAVAVQTYYRIEPTWTLSKLLESDVREEWMIENMLVASQPCLIAGASKGMKTTFAIALAICLASGRNLFNFKTVARRRVHIASAESGKATIKKTVLAIMDAFEIVDDERRELVDGNWLSFDWFVPRVSDQAFLDYYQQCLKTSGAEVAIFDPLYLSIENKQSSQEENGQQLNQLVKTILDANCLPIIVDHTKLSSENVKQYQPLQLSDLSGAGKSNFFRQWLLLGRRERFEPAVDGVQNHRLWLTVGGSAGHAGQWALDIEETNESITDRSYQFDLQAFSEVVEQSKDSRLKERENRLQERQASELARLERKAAELIERVYSGDRTLSLTQNDIQDRLAVRKADAGGIVGFCLNNGTLKKVPGSSIKNGKGYDGYMLSDSLGVTSSGSGNQLGTTWEPGG